MITSTYGLTATERVLPRLALDFTTAVADPRVVTARAANTATRFNQNGLIEIVNANLPRFDFSPTALTCQGQLIEETRTNLFLNSLIDGTNLATQSVTLSAVTCTLSFYGSGSVAISGGHSATVNGVGDFPNRKTYTFTPTAGSSTFTISGDVKFAQLEAGAFATSFIPTTTTSLTRNADVVQMTGTNFSSWYNASEGTFVAAYQQGLSTSPQSVLVADNGTALNRIAIQNDNSSATTVTPGSFVVDNNVSQAVLSYASTTAGSVNKIAFGFKANNFVGAMNGGVPLVDASGTVPVVNRLNIGSLSGTGQTMNSWLRQIMFYPMCLTSTEIQAFSK